MNMKKVGLTALAASLVSFSANAGEFTVSGAASIAVTGYSGEKANTPKTFSMGDQLTFSGGGELDNGINVSMSFVIDDSDVWDAHSITLSSEGLGTLTVAGEGGSSATTSVDGSAAGDIWDAFDGTGISTGVTGAKPLDSDPGNESIFYTLPSLMDGLSVFASYNPQESAVNETETGFGATYTGIEGLTASFATTDIESGTAGTSGDHTAMKLTYAYGPVTVGYSKNEHDVATAGSNNTDLTAWNVAYTVSDELSISYGTEDLTVDGSAEDAEYTAIVVAYTSGGMTLTGKMEDAENVNNTASTSADQEMWTVSAAFAF
tara:strand:- start:55 stop:1011 length:957 start_codon:yes stop_codon:yes gene_type:complete